MIVRVRLMRVLAPYCFPSASIFLASMYFVNPSKLSGTIVEEFH